jgi:hypothetical protein
VWLYLEGDAGRVTIRANSDAAIVSGLIALLIQVYSGCSARQIVDTEPSFIREIGLADHLSPTRANGLHAMLNAIIPRPRFAVETEHRSGSQCAQSRTRFVLPKDRTSLGGVAAPIANKVRSYGPGFTRPKKTPPKRGSFPSSRRMTP